MEEVKINAKSFLIVFGIIAAISLVVVGLNSYDSNRKNEFIVEVYERIETSSNKTFMEDLIMQSDTSEYELSGYMGELRNALHQLANDTGNDSYYNSTELFIEKENGFVKVERYNYRNNLNGLLQLNAEEDRIVKRILENKKHVISILQEENKGRRHLVIYNFLNVDDDKICFLKSKRSRS